MTAMEKKEKEISERVRKKGGESNQGRQQRKEREGATAGRISWL